MDAFKITIFGYSNSLYESISGSKYEESGKGISEMEMILTFKEFMQFLSVVNQGLNWTWRKKMLPGVWTSKQIHTKKIMAMVIKHVLEKHRHLHETDTHEHASKIASGEGFQHLLIKRLKYYGEMGVDRQLLYLEGGANKKKLSELTDEDFEKLGELLDTDEKPTLKFDSDKQRNFLDRSKVKRSAAEQKEIDDKKNGILTLIVTIYNEVFNFLFSLIPFFPAPSFVKTAIVQKASQATLAPILKVSDFTGYKGFGTGIVATPFTKLQEEKET
jgi:hypothetical protein